MICFLQQVCAGVLLMRSLNIELPIHKARYIYSLSFLARYIPGSIWGYLSRSEWLLHDYQVSYASSNYGSILEVALAVSTGFCVLGLCILVNERTHPHLGRFSAFLSPPASLVVLVQ